MHSFVFEVVRSRILVECRDEPTFDLLWAAYGHLSVESENPDLMYSIGEIEPGLFEFSKPGESPRSIAGRGWLLAMFDDDLVISLQLLHPELYFLHAAVLIKSGRAHLFPATAGSGKSTLTWALLHHGFEYFSDELAPMELTTKQVLSFQRPLCLKNEPPTGYAISIPTLTTERAIHLATTDLPAVSKEESVPIAAIFFPRYEASYRDPEPRPVSVARAATRIYVNCLNALAHPASGLQGAEDLAQHVPCFELETADLGGACQGVVAVADQISR